ncbi:amino acid ABC transporter permease [Desulfocurvus sp. DL9XJH121]
MYVKTERHPDLPPPPLETGLGGWLRKNLFSSPLNTALTALGLWLFWVTVPPFVRWAVVDAQWGGWTREACEVLPGVDAGACWVFIKVRLGVLMYGFYPPDERWRVTMAALMLFASIGPLVAASLIRESRDFSERLQLLLPAAGTVACLILCGLGPGVLAGVFLFAPSFLCHVNFRHLTRPLPGGAGLRLGIVALVFAVARVAAGSGNPDEANALALAAAVAACLPLFMGRSTETRWRFVLLFCVFPFFGYWLFSGGAFGLAAVPTDRWGGLSLTLLMASVGMSVSLPMGILLALGRRSDMPVIRSLSIAYIEFIRGVPLISVLFMASVMLPLTLPPGTHFDKLLRALVGISFFYAAYMAEVVRGGLQSISKGQYEAAGALGFRYWRSMRLIILPQALRVVIPGITNTFLGLFKDTTLVAVINLMDILGIVKSALADSDWLGFTKEAYVFAGFAFWIFCFSISRYSMRLEKRLEVKR